ncbi:hypothetical protein J6590_096673 [Homalodisca vitripennis]|nr:hypothetical protein J6590_096673 [Homalodisca vitripennis]
MSFGRSKTLLHFDFSLYGLLLDRVTVIKDLGLYMTPSLDPGVRSGIRYPDVDIQVIASQHQILSLSSRRVALDLIFLFKIVNGLVDCPELLRHIDLHVPAATRLLQPFSRHSHRTVYAYQSVIPRLLRLGNAAHQLEFFGVSMLVFRRGVFSWVSEHGEH